jgi:hypothetical protein
MPRIGNCLFHPKTNGPTGQALIGFRRGLIASLLIRMAASIRRQKMIASHGQNEKPIVMRGL